MAGSRDEMRASDADRGAVGDQLRVALDEGRLDFHEYDTRLRDAYAAKTYGELKLLTEDLPVAGVAPPASAAQSQLVPRQPGTAASAPVAAAAPSVPAPLLGWLRAVWGSWVVTVTTCMVIWVLGGLLSDEWVFWPFWVAVPWGLFLVVYTVKGLARGEPRRLAAKRDRKRAKRERKRELKRRPHRPRFAVDIAVRVHLSRRTASPPACLPALRWAGGSRGWLGPLGP
jgi:hypothetical protein